MKIQISSQNILIAAIVIFTLYSMPSVFYDQSNRTILGCIRMMFGYFGWCFILQFPLFFIWDILCGKIDLFNPFEITLWKSKYELTDEEKKHFDEYLKEKKKETGF